MFHCYLKKINHVSLLFKKINTQIYISFKTGRSPCAKGLSKKISAKVLCQQDGK